MRKSLLAALLLVLTASPALAATQAQIEQTMKKATTFMVEKVSTKGGYVWSYLPDMSRRWGEMEAKPSMVWIQPPGTATMGHLFLDAYHATGDECYYQAAEKVAGALILGQLDNGGWNYFIDFDGPVSKRHWYETVGRNAWRLEEFQHYSENATFDDAGTSESMQFLLRLYLEKRDPRFRPALDKAIGFVLASQYPNGGWPQRWPYDPNYPDYQRYITFNDDVAAENIKFLVMVYQTLGETRVRDSIRRGMDIFLATQQGAPQAGWGLQYTLDLKPAAARTYEPAALTTHTTAANIRELMHFYRLTGDRKYLAGIPAALAWLDSVRLPAGQEHGNRAYPTFIEIGTNQPLYVHRRGSNVVNGGYYVDRNPDKTLGHYSSFRAIDAAGLRREYEQLLATPPAEASKDSPLVDPNPKPLPLYWVSGGLTGSDLNAGKHGANADEIIKALNAQGWWPVELRATSHPYSGDGPATPVPGDYSTSHVGDQSDTSPYVADKPVTGISTADYIGNMARLIEALRQGK